MPLSVQLVLLLASLAAGPSALAEPALAPVSADAGAPVAGSVMPATSLSSPPGATPAPAPTPPRMHHAPIAVAIVVDQLAAWVLRERLDRLPDDGGFARLRREGKYFQEMAYAHAITETAPGHASLFTGKVPREHGIVANDMLGSDGRMQPTVADQGGSSKLVGLDGRTLEGQGSSVDVLEAKSSLVAAVFRSRYPKGQGIIAALSLKDRGALFAAGETADYALWFDPKIRGEGDAQQELGAFVTTKRYEASLRKSGLAAFLGSYLATEAGDRRDGVARIEAQAWKGLDPAWLSENAGVPGSSDYTGFVGAHTASQASKPGAAFRALPESDRLLLEMALRILKAESRDLPVFLSISLSANDYIGHLFGPDSWEAWDELRRLDTALAWFFKELDVFGSQTWSVVLTADHGTVPLEDSPKRPQCGQGVRGALDAAQPCSGSSAHGARLYTEGVRETSELAATKAGLREASGKRLDKIIAGVVYPYIYLTEAAKAALSDDASARARLANRLDSELKGKFKAVHAILDVVPFREAEACPDDRTDRMAALVCNSISPVSERGGDFYIVLKPGAFFDPELVKGTGVAHGSPYGYDRFVPLFVRDASRPELAGQVENKRTAFTQFRDELVRIILSAPSVTR